MLAARGALAATGLTFGLVLAGASPAHAHAELVLSDPADGQNLATAPTELTLQFSEHVEVSRTSVEVVDGNGHPFDVEPPRAADGEGGAEAGEEVDIEDPQTLTVPLPELPEGSYRVSWRTLSSDDLHATYGTFVFGVQQKVATAAQASGSRTDRAETALRWLGLLGFAGVVGAFALDVRMRKAAPAGWLLLRRRLLITAIASGAVGLAGGAGLLALLASRAAGLTSLLGTSFGLRQACFFGLSVIVLTLLVITLVMTRAREGSSSPPWLVTAAALTIAASAIAAAGVGHPAAASHGSWTTMLVVAGHLLGTAVWAGGVIVLAVLRAAAATLRQADDREAFRVLVRRFWPLAGAGVAVTTVTGLQLMGVLVPSRLALTHSGYGQTLLFKIGLICVALLLGLRNSRLARSPQVAHGSGRLLVTEAVVLVSVLGAAALLASSPTVTSPRWAPTPREAATSGALTSRVDDLMTRLTVAPNIPGHNFVAVSVLDTRRPTPAPVSGVTVHLSGPTGQVTRNAQLTSDGSWLVGTDSLRSHGAWQATVTVHRPELSDATSHFVWRVAPTPGTAVGGQNVSALASQASIGLLLAIVLALGGWSLGSKWRFGSKRGRKRARQVASGA
jgi:copper transport protein